MSKEEKDKDEVREQGTEELNASAAAQEQETQEAGQPGEAQDEPAPAGGKDNELDEARQKIEELTDKLLRLHAEFDNYKKRNMKEKAELIRNAGERVLGDFLHGGLLAGGVGALNSVSPYCLVDRHSLLRPVSLLLLPRQIAASHSCIYVGERLAGLHRTVCAKRDAHALVHQSLPGIGCIRRLSYPIPHNVHIVMEKYRLNKRQNILFPYLEEALHPQNKVKQNEE